MDLFRQNIKRFLILGLLWFLPACGEERKAQQLDLSQLAKESQNALEKKQRSEWALSEGQTVLLRSGETLTMLRVTEDSRYLKGSSTSDGRVVADFLLVSTDGKRRKFSLGMGLASTSAVVLGGHTIELLAVSSPPAISSQVNYQVYLRKSLAKTSIEPTQHLEGLRLATLYQPKLGVVELEFLHGEASLIRDPNRCRIDAFGDRSACTKLAVFRTTVGFRFMEQNEDKFLYQLTGVEGLSFVIDQSFEYPSYRLIVEQEGQAEVIALLPVQKVRQLPSRY